MVLAPPNHTQSLRPDFLTFTPDPIGTHHDHESYMNNGPYSTR